MVSGSLPKFLDISAKSFFPCNNRHNNRDHKNFLEVICTFVGDDWEMIDEMVLLHSGDKRLLTLLEYRETRKPVVFSFLINSSRPVGSNFTQRKVNSKSSAETQRRVPHILTSQIPPFLPKVGNSRTYIQAFSPCKTKRDQFSDFRESWTSYEKTNALEKREKHEQW